MMLSSAARITARRMWRMSAAPSSSSAVRARIPHDAASAEPSSSSSRRALHGAWASRGIRTPLFGDDGDDADDESSGGARPSKTARKRLAKEFRSMAESLTALTKNELQRADAALDLGEETLDLVRQASRLPRRNQARARLEALISKRLRGERGRVPTDVARAIGK